jgi:putative transposase
MVRVITDWTCILACITGTVDQELFLRKDYLVTENRILKAQLETRLRLTDADRITLAEIAHRLGRKALEEVANVMKPDTIMGWYRRLVAREFDGSESRRYPGRPRIDSKIEQLVVRMTKESSNWCYDRIVGAMGNLGYTLSDQTVGNILQRHGIPPAQERKRTTTWADFIRAYLVHFHTERNHQGRDNVLLFPVSTKAGKRAEGSVNCKERLGGLLKYYHREAA